MSQNSAQGATSLFNNEKARSEFEKIIEEHKMTAEEIQTLRESFKELDDNLTRSGVSVLIRLLQQNPEFKMLWPSFKNVPDSSLMNSDVLRSHAKHFMAGMKDAVDNLDNPDALYRPLIHTAGIHHEKRVHPSHLKEMLPMILATLSTRSPEIDVAWTRFFELLGAVILLASRVYHQSATNRY